jgi:deoxyadenosine/deoxycytidine kinase
LALKGASIEGFNKFNSFDSVRYISNKEWGCDLQSYVKARKFKVSKRNATWTKKKIDRQTIQAYFTIKKNIHTHTHTHTSKSNLLKYRGGQK